MLSDKAFYEKWRHGDRSSYNSIRRGTTQELNNAELKLNNGYFMFFQRLI